DPGLKSETWRVEVRRPRFEHPRLSAKWFKIRPEKELPGYRYTIWIDGGIVLSTASFADTVLSALNGSGLAFFKHPVRENIFDEAEASKTLPKYAALPLIEQVEHYRNRGYPGTNGLFAAGVIVRDNSKRALRSFGRRWMRENLRWTYQDQLSLPYVLWRSGITPGTIPYDLWDNPLFSLREHNSEL
ncbi:MAG: DUF616 domain-containing protein, partial [Acidobacteriota bacterium]|nr:DUF616 domain-containing protein [Acidobacteriota bacterium]